MITASVGFQCPECARAGAKQSRTISAGQALRRQVGAPVVTYTLIAINVAVYLIETAVDRQVAVGGSSGTFYERFVMYTPFIGARGEWYRLVTGGFMHAGLIHLAFNMWALYVLGPAMEALVGRTRYLLLYGASLLGGSLGVVLASPTSPTVGASGAIFGLFGAFAVYELSRGINPLQSAVGMTILLNLFLTFTIPGISIGGHLGGLAIGGAGAALLLLGRPMSVQSEGERIARAGGVGVLGLACLGAALAIAKARYGLG
jgi:membrane associated rhomboid family serine protease